jgi:hypothetical protein
MVKLEEIVEIHAAMVRRIATVYERHPDGCVATFLGCWLLT